MASTLESRYQEVTERIARAGRRAGRRPGEVILVAVTKYADPEQIRELLAMGHRDFGENRVQVLIQHAAIVSEFIQRQKLLTSTRQLAARDAAESLFPDPAHLRIAPESAIASAGPSPVRWHMIGHLQRNKARKVTDLVRLVHSVDSLRLAEELQQIGLKKDVTIECLLQVNCSGEPQKFGCPLAAAIPLAEQIHTMANVRLRGLMTMAAEGEEPEQARGAFARCRELFEEMRTRGFNESGRFNILSMGMTGDFEVAISEGANIVRIGSAIFGMPQTAMPEHVEAPEPEDPESEGL